MDNKRNFLFVIATLLVLSSLYIVLAHRSVEEVRFSAELDHEAELIRTHLNYYIDNNMNFLKSMRGLFAASERVESDEFSRFVNSLDLFSSFKGIKEVGYVEKVTSENLDDFVREQRLLNPEFRIFPDSGAEEMYVVKYVESRRDKNQIIGHDITSSEGRAIDILDAIDRNRPTLTDVFEFVTSEGEGFLAILPVYFNDMNVSGVIQRRNAVKGAVIVVFEAQTFFETFQKMHPGKENTYLRISEFGEEKIIFEEPVTNPVVSIRKNVEFAGKNLKLELVADEVYFKANRSNNWFYTSIFLTVILGITISSLYFITGRKKK